MEAQLSPVPVGERMNLTYMMLTYFCSNTSMCSGEDNNAKNTNLARADCVLKLAESFVEGADNVSTLFILAASRPCHGTPALYLKATRKAAKELLADDAKRTRRAGKNLRRSIADLLKGCEKPSWAQSLEAAMWDFDAWGTPPRYFNDKRPSLITIQGQHRFTVCLLALRNRLGLGEHRAGELSSALLFKGEGAKEKAIQLADVFQNTNATCSVIVHAFLDHVQAASIGHLTQKREADTSRSFLPQRPFLLDGVAYSAPLIRQIQNPAEQHCQARAKEFFKGLPVNEAGDCLSDLGIEWTEVFSPKDGPPASKKSVDSRRKMIKTMQESVKKDVTDNLARIGMPEKQSSAPLTFVYAAALHPDSQVVKNILRQFTVARDGGICNEDMDCQVLAMLFRLSKQSQRKEEVWSELARIGFSNPMRKVLAELGRIELFETVVASVALRVPFQTMCDHRILDLDDEGISMETVATESGGVGLDIPEWQGAAELARLHKVLLDLCFATDDAVYFTDNNKKNLRELIREAGRMFSALSAFVGEGFKAGEVTKKLLAAGSGRIAKADPTASNKRQTVPGGDFITGNPLPLYVSISGTPVPFDQQVLAEYLAEGQGYAGRVMFMCFAILVIDRALSRRNSQEDRVPQRFEDLLGAMPACAAPLKEALLTRAEDLVVGDEETEPVDREPFFDAKRLEFLKGLHQKTRVSVERKEEAEHRVSVFDLSRSPTSPVEAFLPASVMRALGIMTDAGTTLAYTVNASIVPVMEEGTWRWGQESRALQPNQNLQPTNLLPPPKTPGREEGPILEDNSPTTSRVPAGEEGNAKPAKRRKKAGQQDGASPTGRTAAQARGVAGKSVLRRGSAGRRRLTKRRGHR